MCPIKQYNISIVDNTGKVIHDKFVSSPQLVSVSNCKPYTNYTVVALGISSGNIISEVRTTLLSAETGMIIIAK